MKLIVNIVLVLLLSLALVSCKEKPTSKEPAASSPTPSPMQQDSKPNISTDDNMNTVPADAVKSEEIKLVKKKDKTKYLLSNGIAINNPSKVIKTDKTVVSLNFPQISGLADKDIEKRINDSISMDMENAVKTYISELSDYDINESNISNGVYCQVNLNANNLLSVSLNGLYTSPYFGFLYRLTDGKKLYLKDIFTEGTDYVSLMNQEITEAILGRSGDESDLLKSPFSTIREDQEFSLSASNLYIIFGRNDNGFVRRYSVSIPLSKIDDYVDVADRYSGTERKTQINQNLIIRNNNIFTTEKGYVTKKKNGEVWAHYFQISGLRDSSFEEVINNTIKTSINEVLNDQFFDSLTPKGERDNNCIAHINVSVAFNQYGLLILSRGLTKPEDFRNIGDFRKIYAFDLIHKKQVDVKKMLNDYISKDKKLEDIFCNSVKNSILSIYGNSNTDLVNDVKTCINYTFIMNNALLYFMDSYPSSNGVRISVSFKPNTLKGTSDELYSEVPFKEIISGAPEDFFGW